MSPLQSPGPNATPVHSPTSSSQCFLGGLALSFHLSKSMVVVVVVEEFYLGLNIPPRRSVFVKCGVHYLAHLHEGASP